MTMRPPGAIDNSSASPVLGLEAIEMARSIEDPVRKVLEALPAEVKDSLINTILGIDRQLTRQIRSVDADTDPRTASTEAFRTGGAYLARLVEREIDWPSTDF